MKNLDSKSSASSVRGRFGAFAGVFTPNVLTILGIILFLRIGWVVGQAGLAGALVIIALSNLISLLTGLSLSSVATNMHVKAGGSYYVIARTLGLEIGGAIGIPLYFSQAISVAFYIIGFTEAFIAVFPVIEPVILSTGIVILFGFLAYVGADFALKIQFLILAVLAASILSFFAGGWGNWVRPVFFAEASSAPFWSVFAVFFPAVTGIMTGVSMSGDLKEPARSIPLGTLSSIFVTGLIYFSVALWLGTHAGRDELISDNMIIQKIARWPALILAGVWASTLSSALGSVLAAPRTLQALSVDLVVPKIFGSQMGSPTEPRFAVIITTIMAAAVIQMGNLNFVASIISMFFLNTYGMINLAAGIERLVGNPSFRPRFKVPWYVSLLGAAGCYGAMFSINVPATVIAVFISYGIFVFLKRRSLQQKWGDIRSGIWFTIARTGLLRLEPMPRHAKNWRPNIVVFKGTPHSREQLMRIGSWLSSAGGIVTFYHFLVGDIDKLADRGLRATSIRQFQKYLNENNVSAFAECCIVNDFYEGVTLTLQTHGIAGLEPNTAFMGWSSNEEDQKEQLRLMRRLVALRKSVLFLHFDDERDFGKQRQIDIWWRGRDRNAELMLMLAHIIRQSREWEGTRIRVIRLLNTEEARKGAEQDIIRMLETARVEAEPVVLIRSDPDEPFISILKQASRESDLVFLGMRIPEENELENYAREVTEVVQSTVSSILIRSGETGNILDTESNARRT